ncbi:hypothetical protein CHISP_3537 [Chitinispirillum alkaliphilum]|nr:hypothetical protein CHISP_3537 [Chitinispirillum alkaliphilum]
MYAGLITPGKTSFFVWCLQKDLDSSIVALENYTCLDSAHPERFDFRIGAVERFLYWSYSD